MGCSASHEEPPRQQPSNTKPTKAQAANPHPSINSNPQQANLNKETLSRYMELEKLIHEKEGNTIMKSLKAMEDELANMEAHVKILDQNHKQCQASMEMEKADVDMLKQGGVGGLVASNETVAQEKEEYIEALNKQEIAKKELDEGQRQKEVLVSELAQKRASAEEVQKLIDEQEDILDGIFGGAYGSELENRLESETLVAEEKKRRIANAKSKWHNGRVLIQYAVNQLAFAVKKWNVLKNVPREDGQQRYTLATESRNNLVAANQNITSAQRYLSTIVFPYCKPDEMMTLQRATNNIYTDMQTEDRHGHACNVYTVTHKRCAALLQWFDHVIKSTITKDFMKAKKDARHKEHELQQERVRLIQEKAKELGQTIDIKASEKEDDDDEDDSDKELMVLAAKTGEEETDVTGQDIPAATPLPDNELAPPPSSDDLFGNIDDLKKQHEKDMEEFDRQQELNKARIDQGLQEKLARRRSRKRKTDSD